MAWDDPNEEVRSLREDNRILRQQNNDQRQQIAKLKEQLARSQTREQEWQQKYEDLLSKGIPNETAQAVYVAAQACSETHYETNQMFKATLGERVHRTERTYWVALRENGCIEFGDNAFEGAASSYYEKDTELGKNRIEIVGAQHPEIFAAVYNHVNKNSPAYQDLAEWCREKSKAFMKCVII